MKWTLNPPSRPVQIALLAFVVAGMAVTPLVNRFNGASNKDYPLWYATGQKFVQGEPLYPTDGSVFPFMYPPFAGFALGAISLLGPTGMVVALVLLNAASFFLAVELSVRLVAGTPIVSLWLRTVPSAVCLFFVADMFTLGQPNLGLFVLILGGLMLLRNGHWGWAGTCFALATAIKAFPAVVLIYLLWRREWKAAGAMVLITVFLLVVVPAPQRGFERNAVELKTWADGMLFSGGEKGVGQRPEQSVSWRNQSLLGDGHVMLVVEQREEHHLANRELAEQRMRQAVGIELRFGPLLHRLCHAAQRFGVCVHDRVTTCRVHRTPLGRRCESARRASFTQRLGIQRFDLVVRA